MDIMMTFYKQYGVNSKSQRYIKKIWCLDNYTSNTQLSEKSVLPNGCQNIAIIHGIGVTVRIKDSDYHLSAGTYLCGQMTTKINVVIKECTKIILLQLQPWGLSSLISYDGFSDKILPIEQNLLGDDLLLNQHIITCPEALVTAVNFYFQAIQIDDDETFVETICHYVFAAKGECKVAHILDRFDFSKRKVQTAFKKVIGLTIKQFIDIVRLRSAVNSVIDTHSKHGKGANVAVEHQYFDQSHLVKSFNKTIGTTPSKLNRDQLIMPPKKS